MTDWRNKMSKSSHGGYACLRIDNTVYGDANLKGVPIKTLTGAKAFIKREVMKHDSLLDIQNLTVNTTLSEYQTKILHEWIENICDKQFKIWKKAREYDR